MRIFLATTALSSPANPWARSEYHRIKRYADSCLETRHSITDNPETAEVILFCGSTRTYHGDILRSQLFWTFPHKCFVIDISDRTLPLLPGLYTSLSAQYVSIPSFRACPYFRVADNRSLEAVRAIVGDEPYLYSFAGNLATARQLRSRITSIRDDRALLKHSSTSQRDGSQSYASLLQNSKFILCPRGYGVSTWRIYEAMRAGRVPVILSDDWIPPFGIDWNSFSIRVAEKDVDSLPSLLREYEPKAQAMGELAHHSWMNNLASSAVFNYIGDVLVDILGSCYSNPDKPFRPSRISTLSRQPSHALPFMKEKLKDLLIYSWAFLQ